MGTDLRSELRPFGFRSIIDGNAPTAQGSAGRGRPEVLLAALEKVGSKSGDLRSRGKSTPIVMARQAGAVGRSAPPSSTI